jgi:hypothetical protein
MPLDTVWNMAAGPRTGTRVPGRERGRSMEGPGHLEVTQIGIYLWKSVLRPPTWVLSSGGFSASCLQKARDAASEIQRDKCKKFVFSWMCKPALVIIAHRGWCSECPENTCAGFRQALQNEFQHFETDTQLTKDLHCVLFHGDTVNRMTNASGRVEDVRPVRQLE